MVVVVVVVVAQTERHRPATHATRVRIMRVRVLRRRSGSHLRVWALTSATPSPSRSMPAPALSPPLPAASLERMLREVEKGESLQPNQVGSVYLSY